MTKINQLCTTICFSCKQAFVSSRCRKGKDGEYRPQTYCSRICRSRGIHMTAARRKLSRGDSLSVYDKNGYRLAISSGRKEFVWEHKQIACWWFNIRSIPSGYHIHHRDLDKDHNHPKNLALLTIADHMWLHCQVGDAGFRLIKAGIITIDQLSQESSDPDRLRKLLSASLENQRIEDFPALTEDVDYYRRSELFEIPD